MQEKRARRERRKGKGGNTITAAANAAASGVVHLLLRPRVAIGRRSSHRSHTAFPYWGRLMMKAFSGADVFGSRHGVVRPNPSHACFPLPENLSISKPNPNTRNPD